VSEGSWRHELASQEESGAVLGVRAALHPGTGTLTHTHAPAYLTLGQLRLSVLRLPPVWPLTGHRFPGWGFLKFSGSLHGSRTGEGFGAVCVRV
jgi:hypothetical protein